MIQTSHRVTLACAALAVAIVGLADGAGTAATIAGVAVIDTPAADGSGMYALISGADRRTYLSWVEAGEDKTATLRFARLEGEQWGAPRTVASGRDWFVNWADHPSVTAAGDGTLFAHWLVHNPGSGTYGYGIRIARSADGGRTWAEIFKAGLEYTSDYAGFVSLLPAERSLTAVYLTPTPAPAARHGDAGHEAEHVKTLAVARFGPDGAVVSDQPVDTDVCTCCSTAAVRTAAGLVAAYRDHTGQVRDISVVREVDGRWSAPARVHADGWAINACPTNGPVLAAQQRRVAIAWFTAAGDIPRVRIAFSADAGATFAPPVDVDGGNPVGWPGIVMLEDGTAVVSWLEATGSGDGELRVRRMSPDGRLGAPVTIAPAKAGRSTGIPHLVRVGDRLLVAWRDGRVRTAMFAPPDPAPPASSVRR